MNRRRFLTIAAGITSLVCVSVLGTPNVQAKTPDPTRVEGTLTTLNASTRGVGIRQTNGTLRTLFIPLSAKIERNGVQRPLSAFKIGDRVQARLSADGQSVVKFEGVGP